MKINKQILIYKNLYFLFFSILIIIIEIINYKKLIFKLDIKKLYIKKLKKKKIIIEVDVSGINYRRGPGKFIEGINEILPYNTSNCIFLASYKIYPKNRGNKSDYLFLPFPRLKENIYNKWVNINEVSKLILGPCFVPNRWNLFPKKNFWNERRFSEIIKNVKGIGVHSSRVRNYLAQKSNTTNMIKKYKIIRACTNLKPKIVKPFNQRKIDILFFEKYIDLDYSQQGEQLFKLFKNSSKIIERIKYGNYTKEKMKKLANDSKFIIYFSFFDTGAIGLKEIQNYGVFTFSHQKDLVIDKDTSFFVPELAIKANMKYAYKIIFDKINFITKLNPSTKLISKKNQEINKCQNSLNDLCKSLL